MPEINDWTWESLLASRTESWSRVALPAAETTVAGLEGI